MQGFSPSFSNNISSCIFFIRACYDYIMAIIETILLILLVYYFSSAALFLSMTSNISIIAGVLSMGLSWITPDIKNKLSGNSFFGYITPIAFIILGSAFFACIFTGHGLYACYVGVSLQAIIRPLRYTFYNSFINSTWAASSDEVKSLQAFTGMFSSRIAKWFAALIMILFAVTASFSGNMIVLVSSIVITTIVWLVSVYLTPKITFDPKTTENSEQEGRVIESAEELQAKTNKFNYWAIISTLAIVSSTLLHILKDIVNAKVIGIALLPTIRFWIAIPIVMVFYAASKAIKNCYLENNEYFNITLLIFGAIFIVFAALLPYSAVLQGFTIAGFLPNAVVMMLQNWFFIAFAMFCEMWTPIVTGFLLYPIQNEYFDKDEIFSIIPTITIFQSVGEIIAGVAMKLMSYYQLPINTIIVMVIVFVLVTIAVMVACHQAMNSGCLDPKYLFQEQMSKMIELRYAYRNSLIGILFFGLGAIAMVYGFNIGAGVLMLASTTSFMFEQITAVTKQFSGADTNCTKSTAFNDGSCSPCGAAGTPLHNSSNGASLSANPV
jgi:ATP/ADP translocase